MSPLKFWILLLSCAPDVATPPAAHVGDSGHSDTGGSLADELDCVDGLVLFLADGEDDPADITGLFAGGIPTDPARVSLDSPGLLVFCGGAHGPVNITVNQSLVATTPSAYAPVLLWGAVPLAPNDLTQEEQSVFSLEAAAADSVQISRMRISNSMIAINGEAGLVRLSDLELEDMNADATGEAGTYMGAYIQAQSVEVSGLRVSRVESALHLRAPLVSMSSVEILDVQDGVNAGLGFDSDSCLVEVTGSSFGSISQGAAIETVCDVVFDDSSISGAAYGIVLWSDEEHQTHSTIQDSSFLSNGRALVGKTFSEIAVAGSLFQGNGHLWGNDGNRGGAIHAGGSLTISDSSFVDNSAWGSLGAAVGVTAEVHDWDAPLHHTVVVTDSEFSSNWVDGGPDGGGGWCGGAAIALGAAERSSFSVTISDSLFEGNHLYYDNPHRCVTRGGVVVDVRLDDASVDDLEFGEVSLRDVSFLDNYVDGATQEDLSHWHYSAVALEAQIVQLQGVLFEGNDPYRPYENAQIAQQSEILPDSETLEIIANDLVVSDVRLLDDAPGLSARGVGAEASLHASDIELSGSARFSAEAIELDDWSEASLNRVSVSNFVTNCHNGKDGAIQIENVDALSISDAVIHGNVLGHDECEADVDDGAAVNLYRVQEAQIFDSSFSDNEDWDLVLVGDDVFFYSWDDTVSVVCRANGCE